MIETQVIVKNRAGIHTRPAASIVKLAAKYKSEIFLIRDGFAINAKSIIGVMTLAAEHGCTLTLRVYGDDEDKATTELSEFFNAGFGEI